MQGTDTDTDTDADFIVKATDPYTRGDARDYSTEILVQYFLWEVIVSTSGMDRDYNILAPLYAEITTQIHDYIMTSFCLKLCSRVLTVSCTKTF